MIDRTNVIRRAIPVLKRKTCICATVASAIAIAGVLAIAPDASAASVERAGLLAIPGVTTSIVETTPTFSVVLEPTGTNTSNSTASPDATAVPDIPIDCQVNLQQYVHYSDPGNDISWHWTWKCDFAVEVSGSHTIQYNNYPYSTSGYLSEGTSGNENIRWDGCKNGWWQGFASGTFSAPEHASVNWEGASPAYDVTNCP
jgi:hypothetical protein